MNGAVAGRRGESSRREGKRTVNGTRGRGEQRRRTGFGRMVRWVGWGWAGRPAVSAVLPDVRGWIECVALHDHVAVDRAHRVFLSVYRPAFISRTIVLSFSHFWYRRLNDGNIIRISVTPGLPHYHSCWIKKKKRVMIWAAFYTYPACKF